MKHVIVLALLALAACATSAPSEPAGLPMSDARDCAVFTTVLRDHYRVDESTPYRLQRGNTASDDATYLITCDFAAAGIVVRDYDYARINGPGRENFQSWLQLSKPEYPTPDKAIVAAGSLLGPLAGSGVRCFLDRSARNAWTLARCEQAWVS